MKLNQIKSSHLIWQVKHHRKESSVFRFVCVPLTTRYLSMACTKAKGSILTGPPFHCLTLVQSGCLCSWHFSWWVLKNLSACEPLQNTNNKHQKTWTRQKHRMCKTGRMYCLWKKQVEMILYTWMNITGSETALDKYLLPLPFPLGKSCTLTGNCSIWLRQLFILCTSDSSGPFSVRSKRPRGSCPGIWIP